MSENTQLQTVEKGSIVPMIDGTPAPIALDKMRQMVEYTERFIKSILKEGIDFGKVGDAAKPSLFKAGAEKLCFAFGLAADYDIIDSIEDPERSWTFESYGKKKEAKGYYRYTIKCRLMHKQSNILWATQEGSCESSERGREGAPSNTILKMAQKRAYVGATLNATFTSDRFTVDVEDYQGDQSINNGNGDSDIKWFESKFGSDDRPNKCSACGKNHIVKGDIIGFDKSRGEKAIVHQDCHNKQATPDNNPPTNDEPSNADNIISDLEMKVSKKTGQKIPEMRETALGVVDLLKAKKADLTIYKKSLLEQLEQPTA